MFKIKSDLNIYIIMSKYLLSVLLIVFLFTFTQAKFSVYMPQCATQMFTDRYINYTLANFGHTPYGSNLVGQMLIPQEQQLCEGIIGNDTLKTNNDNINRFLLIKRGNCKFTKKIINAQKYNIDFVIIYDNQKTNQPNVIMANDGFGHLVEIPSIFISYYDGQKLVKAFQKCTDVILNVKFDIQTSKVANLTLWLDANNRQSYIMLRDFKNTYYTYIKNYFNLEIRFKIAQSCRGSACKQENCIGDNKYCLQTNKKNNGQSPITGKQLIQQHLRSYFILKSLKKSKQDAWWNYMVAFDNDGCFTELDIKACSIKIQGKYGIKHGEIHKNVEQAKKNALQNKQDNKQNVLKMFIDEAYEHDIMFYPEATINNRNYYGLFKAADIFNMLCSSLQKPPKQCHSFTKQIEEIQVDDQTQNLWKNILLIIIMMLIFFLVALFIYNRIIRKEINARMSSEVNKMVQHYVVLSEQKSKSNVGL